MKTMLDFVNKIKPYWEGVADIEPTTTASVAHSKGDIFYLDNTLVEATANIAVGATIAVNTNVKVADDVERQIANEANVRAELGAYNLFKVNPITMMNTSQTGWGATISGNVITYANYGGFTITINDDDSITANGTPTANITLVFLKAQSGDALKLSKNKYVLKGSNNANATIKINGVKDGVAYSNSASVNDLLIDVSDSFDLGSNGVIYVEFKANNTFSNFVIYPTICLATDLNKTYQPYAMTNRELTEDISNLKSIVAASSDFADFQTRIANL